MPILRCNILRGLVRHGLLAFRPCACRGQRQQWIGGGRSRKRVLALRTFHEVEFESAFRDEVVRARWQEVPDYYPRYRSRYEGMVRELAAHAGPPCDILEIGGGQLAALTSALWHDRATVADISASCFNSLRERGIKTRLWNLALYDAPFEEQFDVVLLSEVIEHLPIPGHVALRRLRSVLRSGGMLICSTLTSIARGISPTWTSVDRFSITSMCLLIEVLVTCLSTPRSTWPGSSAKRVSSTWSSAWRSSPILRIAGRIVLSLHLGGRCAGSHVFGNNLVATATSP